MTNTTTVVQQTADTTNQAIHHVGNSMMHTLSTMTFNMTDYVIIAILLLSIIMSFFRGFIREALSVLLWVIAIGVALMFAADVAPLFASKISNPDTRLYLGGGLLFIAILIVGGFINSMIGRASKNVGFGVLDRLLGLLFGILRGVLVIAVILLCLSATHFANSEWWKNSYLIPHFQPMIHWLKSLVSH
jgi:membrane protein required for colicin V production